MAPGGGLNESVAGHLSARQESLPQAAFFNWALKTFIATTMASSPHNSQLPAQNLAADDTSRHSFRFYYVPRRPSHDTGVGSSYSPAPSGCGDSTVQADLGTRGLSQQRRRKDDDQHDYGHPL